MRFPGATHHVVCFQYRQDAEPFHRELVERMAEFGLELAEEKTRLIRFGRFAGKRPRPSIFSVSPMYAARTETASSQ